MLAAALGDEKAEERALLMRIDRNSDHPMAGDYEDLIDFYKKRNQIDTAINVARTGIDALPNDRNLVILRAEKTQRIQNSAAWLDQRELGLHHHIALDSDADFARLARFICGQAVGLVLAGAGSS